MLRSTFIYPLHLNYSERLHQGFGAPYKISSGIGS